MKTLEQKELRSLVARTALEILAGTGMPFRMEYWVSYKGVEKRMGWADPNICGTACCLVGHMYAIEHEKPVLSAGDNEEISGFASANYIPPFLFDSDWSDDRDQCGVRCLMWLNGEDTEDYEATDIYPVPEDLREQLEQFA
jgi:hypothetical protein